MAFSYHKALAPLLWVFLFIQVIELTVVHILLLQWWPVFAWILFSITALGLVWMTALLRSFYTRPIELNDEGVRIRCGFILDLDLPFEKIASIETSLDKERAMAKTTCNPPFLFMSEPNVVLNVTEPIQHKNVIGQSKSFNIVAVRLDEQRRFLDLLSGRMQANQPADAR